MPAYAEKISIALSGAEDAKKNGEYVFAKAFLQHLNANGMETTVHPSNSIGKEKERFDQTAQGLLHVNFADTALMFKLAPMTKAAYLPFMYKNNAHFDDVVEKSQMISVINNDLIKHGVRFAGFPFRGGQAGVFNTLHEVTTFEDLSDIRVRAKDKLQLKLFSAWGAKATIVDWSEVANALQTGVANGYVNPPAAALLFGHTGILKYFTPMNIGPSARSVILSEDWYSALSNDKKEIVDEGLKRGLAANRLWTQKWMGAAEKMLSSKGVLITPLKDGEREKFVNASKPLWPIIVGKDNMKILEQAVR
ncbi:MAG: TRAP transporter substrate-binding protein [Sneathiellales bacterium]|nr:TRAP transporter substrate-binding protein [Sneathiellales bacterium]